MTSKLTIRADWDEHMIKRKVENAGVDASVQAAEYLLEEANKTAPYEEGDLTASGEVGVENGEALVNYTAPYAVRQHEGDFEHSGDGRRKWLELAAQERERNIGDEMADSMKRSL